MAHSLVIDFAGSSPQGQKSVGDGVMATPLVHRFLVGAEAPAA